MGYTPHTMEDRYQRFGTFSCRHPQGRNATRWECQAVTSLSQYLTS